MKQKFHWLVAVTYFWVVVANPFLHLLQKHEGERFASLVAGLEEYCGGEKNPCSRSDHDHGHTAHKHPTCVTCKTVSFFHTDLANLKIGLASPEANLWVVPASFDFYSASLLAALAPRAPPVSLA